MNAQATFQRICAYSGIVCVLLFFGGFVAAGFLPPLSPSMSAAQIAAHYQAHTAGIRLGAGLIFLSSGFYVWFTAVISGTGAAHPRRASHRHQRNAGRWGVRDA